MPSAKVAVLSAILCVAWVRLTQGASQAADVSMTTPAHIMTPSEAEEWEEIGSFCYALENRVPAPPFSLRHARTLRDCKTLCERNDDCTGVQFNPLLRYCKVWTVPISARKIRVPGFKCLRREQHFPASTTTMVVTQDIIATAVAAGQFSILAEALTKVDLVDTLKGTGPFTVFAPTDDAFALALEALDVTKEQLLARDDLADILKYHVLSGKIESQALQSAQTVDTLLGQPVTITKDANGVTYAGANVVTADVVASNGVIHIINKVVLPPAASLDIVATAAAAGQFTILAEALTKVDLVDTLKGTGPFTVFAPTDDAFASALEALGVTKEQLLARDDLADILKYHVLSGKIESQALQSTQTVDTLLGQPVTITKDANGVTYAGANVVTADVVASNGVIHIINKVVLPTAPSRDIMATAIAAGQFNTLAEALTRAGLVDTLKGAGPFTVFAPTDDAFAAALDALGVTKEQLLARDDLVDILKYHVLSGKIESQVLQSTQTVGTLMGQPVTITKDANGVTYAGANVVTADVLASNGVIHIISAVVLPPPLV